MRLGRDREAKNIPWQAILRLNYLEQTFCFPFPRRTQLRLLFHPWYAIPCAIESLRRVLSLWLQPGIFLSGWMPQSIGVMRLTKAYFQDTENADSFMHEFYAIRFRIRHITIYTKSLHNNTRLLRTLDGETRICADNKQFRIFIPKWIEQEGILNNEAIIL